VCCSVLYVLELHNFRKNSSILYNVFYIMTSYTIRFAGICILYYVFMASKAGGHVCDIVLHCVTVCCIVYRVAKTCRMPSLAGSSHEAALQSLTNLRKET